jgi:hypothetical protein
MADVTLDGVTHLLDKYEYLLLALDPDSYLECGMFCSLRSDEELDEVDNLLSYKYAMDMITCEALR